MRSFVDLERTLGNQPPRLGAVLARIDTGRGMERLSSEQLPQLLTALAHETRIASITASNAIEGVIVAPERAERIATAPPTGRLRNRNEREFAGYRDAIDEMLRLEELAEPPSIPWLAHVHRRLFGHLEGGGGQLKREPNLIVSFEGDRREVVFKPPTPAETPYLLDELCARYVAAADGRAAHPLILLGAFVLDLLAIHPFADGNGRVARLATTYLLLRAGYGVPRYVSLEQRILDTKDDYYDVLTASQRGWHDGSHDPWPWLAYLAGVVADAYDRFEAVLGAHDGAGLSKQERVRRHVLDHAPALFGVRDVRRALPGVSDQTIRLVLAELRAAGAIASTGRGRSARWQRT